MSNSDPHITVIIVNVDACRVFVVRCDLENYLCLILIDYTKLFDYENDCLV